MILMASVIMAVFIEIPFMNIKKLIFERSTIEGLKDQRTSVLVNSKSNEVTDINQNVLKKIE